MVASKHKTREDGLHVNFFFKITSDKTIRKKRYINRQLFVQTISKKQQMLHQEY